MTSKPFPAPTAPDVPGRALVPLRAFLGFTFCFAGLQKLANPRFFDAADPASIQAQLAGAARRSPVHALISPLTHVAVLVGILIALGELAAGLTSAHHTVHCLTRIRPIPTRQWARGILAQQEGYALTLPVPAAGELDLPRR